MSSSSGNGQPIPLPNSPSINNFPVEILRRIMEFCAARHGVDIPIQLSQPPWPLTYVCSLWRQVALTTPELWDYLRIYKAPDGRFNIDAIEEVIRRNQFSPMDISLQWKVRNAVASNHHRNKDLSFVATLCKSLFHEGIRVRRLVLKPEPRAFSELQRQLELAPPSVFQSLEELEIVFLGTVHPFFHDLAADHMFAISDPSHPLWKTPKLRLGTSSRYLTQSILDTSFSSIETDHITHLTLKKVIFTSLGIYQLLQDAHLLVGLTISTFDDEENNALPSEMLHLPALQHFSLHASFGDIRPITELLARMTSPNLSALCIRGMLYDRQPNSTLTSESMDFIRRCPSLTFIDLEECGPVDHHQVLEAAPLVQKFRAYRSGVLKKSTIQAITQQQLGKNLKSLHCAIRERDVEEFMNLLERQWESVESQYANESTGLSNVRLRTESLKINSFNDRVARLQKLTGSKCRVEFIYD